MAGSLFDDFDISAIKAVLRYHSEIGKDCRALGQEGVRDFLTGRDPSTGESGDTRAAKNVAAMRRNPLAPPFRMPNEDRYA